MTEKTPQNPEVFEYDSNAPLWEQMVIDLHLLMGHTVIDRERETLLNKGVNASRKPERPRFASTLDTYTFYIEKLPKLTKTQHLRNLLLSLRQRPNIPSLVYKLHIEYANPNPVCHYKTDEKTKICNFDIAVNETDSPHAQEELLHAAESILLGTTQLGTRALNKTSEQLVHTSFVMDMAFSLAALEEGIWERWNQKANELQLKQRENILATGYWGKTLIGKSLNKRFQYSNMTLKQVGIFWKHLGVYFKDMFGNQGGKTDDETVEIFELGCLTYGVLHRDLSYSLVDLPIGEEMNDEQVGRVVVDWAKKVLSYYEGTKGEIELLAHHSPTFIPENYYNYIPAKAFILNHALLEGKPLDTVFNIATIRHIAEDNWTEAVEEIMNAYTSKNSLKLHATLRKYRIPLDVFQQLEKKAEENLEAQTQDRRADILPLQFLSKTKFTN